MSWIEIGWWLDVLREAAVAAGPAEHPSVLDRIPDRRATEGVRTGERRVVPALATGPLYVERRAYRRDGCEPDKAPELGASGTLHLAVVP